MEEETKPAGEGAKAFDPESFKADILSANKQFQETLIEGVQATVASTLKGFQVATPTPIATGDDPEVDEYKDELDALGIDDPKAAKALSSMMDKKIAKKTQPLKQDILNTVDEGLQESAHKAEYVNQTKMMYPQVVNKQSPLFKQSQIVYARMTKAEKALPTAEANAVRIAAGELGIQPVSLAQAAAMAAENPTGDGGGGKIKEKKLDKDMAAFFGVDVKKVEEKMKVSKTPK